MVADAGPGFSTCPLLLTGWPFTYVGVQLILSMHSFECSIVLGEAGWWAMAILGAFHQQTLRLTCTCFTLNLLNLKYSRLYGETD